MLGKSSRPPFRRTTSMTGITVDVASDTDDGQPPVVVEGRAAAVPNSYYDHRSMTMISPRYYGGRTTSGNETPSFLRSCGLCNRRLVPCRDIFMYRSHPRDWYCPDLSGSPILVLFSHKHANQGRRYHTYQPVRDLHPRGDAAFCSQECREQKMKEDETKENNNNMRIKNNGENHHDSSKVSTIRHTR